MHLRRFLEPIYFTNHPLLYKQYIIEAITCLFQICCGGDHISLLNISYFIHIYLISIYLLSDYNKPVTRLV